MMNIQTQNHRSEMKFSDIDVADFDGEIEMQGSAASAREEVLDICGLSDAMMDEMREMMVY